MICDECLVSSNEAFLSVADAGRPQIKGGKGDGNTTEEIGEVSDEGEVKKNYCLLADQPRTLCGQSARRRDSAISACLGGLL
jgi:hypothetical protein